MELKELRIGNYYKWYADGQYYYYKVEAKDFANDNYKNFQPIELTEEILLKCGFNKVREYFELYWIVIQKDKQGYYIHINCGNNYINNLHQLQNLYWCLCGEEL